MAEATRPFPPWPGGPQVGHAPALQGQLEESKVPYCGREDSGGASIERCLWRYGQSRSSWSPLAAHKSSHGNGLWAEMTDGMAAGARGRTPRARPGRLGARHWEPRRSRLFVAARCAAIPLSSQGGRDKGRWPRDGSPRLGPWGADRTWGQVVTESAVWNGVAAPERTESQTLCWWCCCAVRCCTSDSEGVELGPGRASTSVGGPDCRLANGPCLLVP
jgi:hypothetical protein